MVLEANLAVGVRHAVTDEQELMLRDTILLELVWFADQHCSTIYSMRTTRKA